MARRSPDPPVRNHREDRNNPGVSGTQGNSPDVTREQVEDVILNQLHANTFYRSVESTDEPDKKKGWRSRVRDFLSCSRLVNVVKTTVVMATLITSLALILVQITSPHPDFEALASRSALVGRLENQVLILGERLKNREAVVSSLEDAVSVLKEHAKNRSTFFIRHEDKVPTLEKRLNNCSALVNHLVDHCNLTENRSALAGHLKNEASTGEERSLYPPGLVHLLENRVSTIEEHFDNRSAMTNPTGNRVLILEERSENQTALIGFLKNKLSVHEDLIDNGSGLINLLENRVLTLEKQLENSSALVGHLKNEVSTLEERLENRVAQVSLPENKSGHNLHEQQKSLISRLENGICSIEFFFHRKLAKFGRIDDQLSSHNLPQKKQTVLFKCFHPLNWITRQITSVICLEHQLSSYKHTHEQRKALLSRLKHPLWTFKKWLENRLAILSRLDQLPSHSHTHEERKGMFNRLKQKVSTFEEWLEKRMAMFSRLEDQVSCHNHTQELYSRLEQQMSTLEKRLDSRSALVSRLEGQVSLLEEHLKTRSASDSRLAGPEVSNLEKGFDNREDLSSQLAYENPGDKKQTVHVQESKPQQIDLKAHWCSKPGHVFHLESPDGQYRYGFNEAQQACAEKGAVLASLDQLYEDQPDGFWLCKCGWISDARSGLVMHNARADCLNKTGFHQCTRGKTWNVWCFCLPGTHHG